ACAPACFVSRPWRPSGAPLFPYSTLFRSLHVGRDRSCRCHPHGRRPVRARRGGRTGRTKQGERPDLPIKRWETAKGLPYRSPGRDRKSTRLNSSHVKISYAVFCLKKKITS